jgi:hypothetical protein
MQRIVAHAGGQNKKGGRSRPVLPGDSVIACSDHSE